MGEKKGFFSRLVEGLTKTRDNIVSGIDAVFSGFSKIDEEFYEELEEILAEVFDRRIGAMMAIIELMKEDVAQEIARKKGEVR